MKITSTKELTIAKKHVLSVKLSRWNGIEIKVDEKVVCTKFILSRLGKDEYDLQINKEKIKIVMDFLPLWGFGRPVVCEVFLNKKSISKFDL